MDVIVKTTAFPALQHCAPASIAARFGSSVAGRAVVAQLNSALRLPTLMSPQKQLFLQTTKDYFRVYGGAASGWLDVVRV